VRWTVALLALVALSGCVRSAPGFSLGKYARSNGAEQVRLEGAVGGVYSRETEPDTPGADEDEYLAIPLVEAAGTVRLHELYGVSVTASTGLLTVEGQLRFGDPALAFGILHGAGVGVVGVNGDPRVQINLIGGGFAQIGVDNQNFVLLGARYVFDDVHGDATMLAGASNENGLHYVDVGVGWLGQLFTLFGIGAEVHGGVIVPVDGSPAGWFILPTVTLHAAF